jgi:chemotaxis signal transduction protein
LKVKEIIGMMPITVVPQTPGYIKGVINLRGKVIPVIDLRLKFAMSGRRLYGKNVYYSCGNNDDGQNSFDGHSSGLRFRSTEH